MRAHVRIITIGLGCLLLLISCGGPQVKNLYVDETFGSSAVRSGEFYVGGVVYGAGELENRSGEWRTLTNQLWTEMADNIKDCYIAPGNKFANLVNDSVYFAVMDEYERKGTFGDEVRLLMLKAYNGKQAYVALGRIENDEHWNKQDKVQDSTGAHVATKYTTCRKLRMRMEVYDVMAEKFVWSGSFMNTDCTTNEYAEIFDDSDLIEALIDYIVDEEKDRVYPPVPGLVWVADDIFKSFAKSLPEE